MMHEAPGFVITRASPLLPPEQAEIAARPGKKNIVLYPARRHPMPGLERCSGQITGTFFALESP